MKPWNTHYDPGVPEEVSYPNAPLYTLLEQAAEQYPDRVATNFMGARISYQALWSKALRFASALQALGVQPGDRVALMLPNSPQYILGYFGTLLTGAAVVNVNPLHTPRELRHQLIDAETKVLVILSLLWPRYAEIADEVPVQTIITTGIEDFLPFPKNLLYPLMLKRQGHSVRLPRRSDRYDLHRLLSSYPPTPKPVAISPGDLALLQYTGGTTGTPKAAMLSHENLLANTYQLKAWAPELRGPKEVMLCVLPFFHVYGMTVAMNLGISLGAKLVLLPRFKAKEAVAAIERYRVTLFPGVPTLYIAVSSLPGIENRSIRSVKVCNSGAAPLPQEGLVNFEHLTGAKISEGYGLTEASPVTHSNPINGQRKIGSIGLPLPSVDARIVDTEGHPLPPGEVGELCVRGPNVMMGYWNRPDESRAVLQDDWLFTGDMARMDEEGYFYIVDRKKDLIIAGGYNIYPREVEEVLYTHPSVREAAVIGIPDAYRGETVKAFVSLKEDASLSTEELEAHCRKNLAAYKVPRAYEFMDELPKTAVGKILRRRLRPQEESNEKT